MLDAVQESPGLFSVDRRYYHSYPRDFVFAQWVSGHRRGPFYRMVSYEPTEGGDFVCEIETPKGLCYLFGEFKIVIPGEMLLFTFGWDGIKQLTEIEVKFVDSDGGTLVYLTQNNLHSRVIREIQQASWDNYHKFLEYQLEIESLRQAN